MRRWSMSDQVTYQVELTDLEIMGISIRLASELRSGGYSPIAHSAWEKLQPIILEIEENKKNAYSDS